GGARDVPDPGRRAAGLREVDGLVRVLRGGMIAGEIAKRRVVVVGERPLAARRLDVIAPGPRVRNDRHVLRERPRLSVGEREVEEPGRVLAGAVEVERVRPGPLAAPNGVLQDVVLRGAREK